jgi:uncharacterized glyoxalase superfamily protein PhnB
MAPTATVTITLNVGPAFGGLPDAFVAGMEQAAITLAPAAGAQIVRPLTDEPYGSLEYSARDPEGNLWSFGTYWP